MSHAVCIILVIAELAVPIKLTTATIALHSVNKFEEPFLLGSGDKKYFLLRQRKGKRQDSWGCREGKGKFLSPNKGNYLFSLSLCVALELAIYSLLNFISDFAKW